MDVHRCRFVPYTPSAINALAFSHPSAPTISERGPLDLRLAIGRANGDIEVWNPLKGGWFQEAILHSGKDRSIDGLAWTQNPDDIDSKGFRTPGKSRLFSIGYSTAVTEWDIVSGRPIRHSSGNYGEIWCMAAQPKGPMPKKPTPGVEDEKFEEAVPQAQIIAVGCAGGAIILFNTSDGDLNYARILARPSKKKSRVLSITFQNRHTIVAGHADSTIRVYDIRNTQQTRNMTLGAGPKGGPKETLVWSVRCLNDGTIVSGDSTGTLSFWDGKNYTVFQRIKSHEADILDIAVSADGQSVFSGGMDRRTTLCRRIEGGGLGPNRRWAKVTHQRMHRHDVKAMAAFEAKNMSIMVSGGLDTAPMLVPISEFGRENHRALSHLPQQPVLASASRKRLMMSWWEREVRIWTVPKRSSIQSVREKFPDIHGADGGKLLARILIQGEESITFADLSSDGKILVVSTAAQLRLFRLRPRLDTLKIQKLSAPSDFTKLGARLIQISPDVKWLITVRADNRVQLYRIRETESPRRGSQILPKPIDLKRLLRDLTTRQSQLESLGDYNRLITRVAFSADSRILAVADISGYLDTWVLEGHEDLFQEHDLGMNGARASASPSDDHSDDDSDGEDHPVVVLGQHWVRNPSTSLIIKLPAAPLILTFRPSSNEPKKPSANGNVGVHPTRNTPYPRSHDLPNGEDRLLVLTAENQMYEFNVLSGRISDWSRRNPSSVLPQDFRDLRDRAMGAVWDVQRRNERVWLYGVNWLWMFDLSRDLPALEIQPVEPRTMNGEIASKKLKRKSPGNRNNSRPKHDTGAGSKVRDDEIGLGVSVGRKVRKIEGAEAARGQLLNFDTEQSPVSDDEDETLLASASALVHLRRSDGRKEEDDEGESNDENLTNSNTINDDAIPNNQTHTMKRSANHRPSHWHTFKYRPILGIVPLCDGTDDEDEEKGGGSASQSIEVALVERPLWDLDLPPVYHGEHEWNT